MFGSDIAVAPITQYSWDADTELAVKEYFFLLLFYE